METHVTESQCRWTGRSPTPSRSPPIPPPPSQHCLASWLCSILPRQKRCRWSWRFKQAQRHWVAQLEVCKENWFWNSPFPPSEGLGFINTKGAVHCACSFIRHCWWKWGSRWPFKECGFHVGSLCVVTLHEISKSVFQDHHLLIWLIQVVEQASLQRYRKLAELYALALFSSMVGSFRVQWFTFKFKFITME